MGIPIPRNPDVDLTSVPRHWAGGSVVATAVSNGLNLLFPHGERFFVRSVNRFMDRIEDPTLRAQVKGFFGQEGRHAHAHDELNDVLRTQGFEIDRFLDRYEQVSRWLEERMPAKLNLAGTAAAEHYTAIMAEGAFARGVLDELHPAMQKLLAWHAAEEIEHKAVAFDVLQLVDPSYALRMAGLVYATVMLGALWATASVMLLRQERIGLRGILRDLRSGPRGEHDPVIRRVFVAGIRQYIRRGFHPRNKANEHIANAWFAAKGWSLPDAA